MNNRILPPDWRDRSRPLLPEPWVEDGAPDAEKFKALESAAGSQLTKDVLTPEELRGELMTPRAIQILGRRWRRLRNVDTDEIAYIRLQQREQPEQPSVRVSAVVFPFQPGKPLTGATLRNLPVQAITLAYSRHEDEGRANLLRSLALAGSLSEDPLAPLPPASAEDAFTARAARQYVAIEEQRPDENVVEYMAALNGAAKSSVQRWVARARKRGFLPPAQVGRRG